MLLKRATLKWAPRSTTKQTTEYTDTHPKVAETFNLSLVYDAESMALISCEKKNAMSKKSSYNESFYMLLDGVCCQECFSYKKISII